MQKIYKNLNLEDLKGEIWRDIPGYEKRYQVSNLGRVKSLQRIVKYFIFNGYKDIQINKFVKNKILRQRMDHEGYILANLSTKSKIKRYKTHRLVMLVFKGKSILQVNHKNGIKEDNRLENLEYVTQEENMRHAFKNGLRNAKWSYVSVLQYDKQGNFIKKYESITKASKETKVNLSDISLCVNNKLHSAGGYIWKKL